MTHETPRSSTNRSRSSTDRSRSSVALPAALTLLAALLLAPPVSAAQDAEPHAFEREFALATYGTAQTGSYSAAGVGGRARWEPSDWLGIEVYLEATLVDWPEGGLRHDYPNGFSLYLPLRVGDWRIKPFLGLCDILSFVEPEQPSAPRADDVLIGAHGGLGAELALHSLLSAFVDLQANVYMGHERSVGGWTGSVDAAMGAFWSVQMNIGVQLHVGQR